jgi:hypothetical protein
MLGPENFEYPVATSAAGTDERDGEASVGYFALLPFLCMRPLALCNVRACTYILSE